MKEYTDYEMHGLCRSSDMFAVIYYRSFGFFQVKHLSIQADNVCYSTAADILGAYSVGLLKYWD